MKRAIPWIGTALLLVYTAPLFHPPAPTLPTFVPDAPLLERLFPGVPAAWVVIRVLALALATWLLSDPAAFRPGESSGPAPATRRSKLRGAALGVAVLHALWAVRAKALGPAGQTAYLLVLGVPALLLAVARRRSEPLRPAPARDVAWIAAVILVWIVARLWTDLGSPRLADVVDGWRGFVDIVLFASQSKNLLTDLYDAQLPGVGGVLTFLHGMPLYQSGLLAPAVRSTQLFQIVWIAASAAGVGALARTWLGPRAAAVAVAVFLFAPFTRLVALFPGPFLVGPVYGAALALCAVVACRRRSEAALATLGAIAGISLTYPGVVPTAALMVAWTGWTLRRDWRSLWIGAAAGLASFAAVVVPALSNVLAPARMMQHFGLHGTAILLEGAVMGQLPVDALARARAVQVWRPFDIVVAAVLAPFANPRTSFRLWGDAIFDPVGAALLAIGLVACARSALTSAPARLLLLWFLAALCPAFVSPVDRVDIAHAVVLPVPVALLSGVGFAVIARRMTARWRRCAAAVTVVLVCAGGTILFDVVNPRTLASSSLGIVFRAVSPDAYDRVIVLDYPRRSGFDVRWLMVGPMTAFAGERPVGYLEYEPEALSPQDLAAAGKDLLFWTPGLEHDMGVAAVVCRHWPHATLYEIWDQPRLGRVHGAYVGTATWTPRAAADRWRSASCSASDPSP